MAPDAGTEVECPKCGTVFPAPEPKAEIKEETPKKKKTEQSEPDEKSKKQKTAKKAKGEAGVPKKRKAKKRKTSKAALIGVLSTGGLLLAMTAGVLIWFFLRTSKSVEMMYYLPEDCTTVRGMNIGHAQKYPEFYKQLSSQFNDTEMKAAGEALAKAVGTDLDGLIDYVIFGSGKSGSAIVIRTKEEIDSSGLKDLPGAETKTLDGKTYYIVTAFTGSGKVRVFSPTNRLLVFCSTDISEAVFKKMLNGHADSREKTIGMRMGPLGKRLTRGTFWAMEIYGEGNKPPPAPPAPKSNSSGGQPDGSGGGGGGSDDSALQFANLISETLAGAQGVGMKASIGSREVRFELVVWYQDGEKATSTANKWNESELGKGDEGEPPRWWKDQIANAGSKKVATQLLSNLGFGSSGELFYAKTSVETKDVQEAIGSVAGKVRPGGQPGPNNPGGPGGPQMPPNPGGPGPGGPKMPGPGGPGPGVPGPGGMPPRPGGRVRRVWGRR